MHQDTLQAKRYHTVLLCRSSPVSSLVAALEARLRACQGPVLIFFHGPAVVVAKTPDLTAWERLAQYLSADLWVCDAAWRRRSAKPLRLPFVAATSVLFWSCAVVAGEVLSLGFVDD